MSTNVATAAALTGHEITLACEKAGEEAQASVYDFYKRSEAHQKGHESSAAAHFEAEEAYQKAYYDKEEELYSSQQ